MRIRHALVCVAVMVLGSGVSDATVTQVDGTIIPVTNRLQTELDAEGETLDAILDAAELPQIFLPNLAQAVGFTDIAEGAGFENSFGWYNVGDDVFTAQGRAVNLHPILGCGSPMLNHAYVNDGNHDDHHHGNPAYYFTDAEADDFIAVDFFQEMLAGRYKGGFIGFYLVTPEGRPNNECGDFLNRTDNFFGFIYFTQKDLNDDGDFVHHLVYSSGIDPDLFYFGFEDLFRGGDNDFEDMASKVDGLTPPCIPTAEVCDGRDNDCDGQIDDADPDLTGVGDPCLCDGVALTCNDGVVFGECQNGETICVAGTIECTSTTTGTAEVCDNLDNNCNNAVDDNVIDDGTPCDGPDADLCIEGVEVCDMGVLVCDDNTGNNLETCNDNDDDCDGTTDESPIDEGGPCHTDVGECTGGIEVCIAGGVLDCQGESGPFTEVCNGLDDNCNGVIDDSPTDVGQPCGVTDVGECDFGTTICNAGTLDCAGEVGPVPETCDTLDNDCDTRIDEMPVDVGQPCGSDVGVCEPGSIVCTPTGPECVGETGPSMEECNSLDDNCNGVVDDNPIDEGGVCGDGDGVCEPGVEVCIDGSLQCVGGVTGSTETCNGLDDDCDGTVDEGDLCDGGVCGDGICSAPCADGEFPCPIGEMCQNDFCIADPCFGVVCPDGAGGERNVCEDGSCVAVCDTVTCNGDLVCRTTDGACVPDTCEFLDLCADDELCKDDECVANPCFEVECGEAQFCRQGDCIDSCGGVQCEVGEVCRDGACRATGCLVDCPDGQICDPDSAMCAGDPCNGVSCGRDQACDSSTGECVDDPCFGVECPGDEVCDFGDCFDPPVEQPDAGPPHTYVTPGGSGCHVGSPPGGGWSWLLLVAGAVVVGVGRRRRWRSVGAAVVLLGLALGASACNLDPYCIDCASADGDGGTSAFDAMSTAPDADIDAGGPGCQDGVVFPEICDGFDNDCDGPVDEDFDFDDDIFNCGGCGTVCQKTGTISGCDSAECVMTGCFPGNVDLNGDLGDPFDQSDGCEYRCFVSNGGVEACDGIDNDCDGATDEDTDFDSDVNHCGQCGRVCSFFQVTGAICTPGGCTFDRTTDCNPGFIDINMMPDDGCEYQCTPSGAEVCDLRDNDCDGAVDEDFDLMADENNCGRCGQSCSFPNASPTCTLGMCGFDPATDCVGDFHDVNGNPLDGCEYGCTVTGAELCNLDDDDCNGVVDDMPADAGGACNNAPSGTATGACTDTGTVICSVGTLLCAGAPEPTTETCDNIDNDCNGPVDDGVTRACYGGPPGTEGVGVCRGGSEACTAGVWTGVCGGQVVPGTETCDNSDEDCDASVDEAVGGGPLTQACYGGTAGTLGVGECVGGTQTCTFGVFGACMGQVVDQSFDICGDGLDTDCDNLDDAAEGCTGAEAEVRLDAPGGSNGSAAGEDHSFDLHMAHGGGSPGARVYAVWSDLGNGASDVFFRRSTDGGVTWNDIVNLTGGLANASVKPLLVVAPIAANDVVYVFFQSVASGVRDIRFVVSTDSGATFTAPSARLDGGEDAFHHHAAVSADGATVVVVWEALNTGTLARNIVSRASVNTGGSFAAARTINVGSGGSPLAGRPQVGLTSAGRFVWAWREIRGGTTQDVFAAFSDSASAAIGAGDESRIDSDSGDNRASDFPQLRVNEGNVYLVWEDVSTAGGGADVIFSRSVDGGASFGAEIVIDDPAGEASSSFTPTLAIDAGGAGTADDRVFVAWEDRREGTQIYTAVSTNGGGSFGAAVRASNSGGGPIAGVTRRPVIAFAGGEVLIVAYNNDLDLGTGTEHVFASASIDGGATWQLTHTRMDTGSGKALNPAIARSTGSGLANAAAVGWTDHRSGTGINGDPYSRRLGQ